MVSGQVLKVSWGRAINTQRTNHVTKSGEVFPPEKKQETRHSYSSCAPPKLKSQSSPQTIKSDVTMETAGRESPTGGGWGGGRIEGCGIQRKEIEAWERERQRWSGWRQRQMLMERETTDSDCIHSQTTPGVKISVHTERPERRDKFQFLQGILSRHTQTTH